MVEASSARAAARISCATSVLLTGVRIGRSSRGARPPAVTARPVNLNGARFPTHEHHPDECRLPSPPASMT